MQYITLIALIVGLLMYLLTTNGKTQEIGRILFAAGAFGICIAGAAATLHIFH